MPSLLVYRQNICLSSFISVTIRTTRNCQLKKQQLGRASPQLLAQQVSPCSVTAHWYFQLLSQTLNLHLRSFLVYEYCSTHFISVVKNVSGNQKTSPSFSCSVSQQLIIHHKKKERKKSNLCFKFARGKFYLMPPNSYRREHKPPAQFTFSMLPSHSALASSRVAAPHAVLLWLTQKHFHIFTFALNVFWSLPSFFFSLGNLRWFWCISI